MKYTTITHTIKIQGSCSLEGYDHWEDTYELTLPLKQYTTAEFWALAEAEWAKNPNSQDPAFGKPHSMTIGANPVQQ